MPLTPPRSRGGIAPYGWIKDRTLKQWVQIPEEQKIVHYIQALRDAGASCEAIANALTSAGTPPRVGDRWHAMTVWRIGRRAMTEETTP
jgi:hypothetical protein